MNYSYLFGLVLFAAAAIVGCATAATPSVPPSSSIPSTPSPTTPTTVSKYDAVVSGSYSGAEGAAVDGAKMYKWVANAVDDAPANATKPYVIFIKNGRYYEKLTVAKPFITFIGESRDKTILTFDAASDTKKPDGTTYGTSGSGSITVRATDFRAENLTIENGFDYPANAAKATDDPTKFANARAVALKTEKGNDRAVIKNVTLVGFQDTLFIDSGTQYFTQCTILGHVDFIFGAGQAVFDDCDIISRDRGSASNNGYLTAASTSTSNAFGFLFVNCRLKKETPAMADNSVTLGRPWHPTSNLPDGTRAADPNAVGSVVFKNCWMDSHIAAKGWDSMTGRDKDGKTISFYPQDSRFFEYGDTGPGAIKNDARRQLSESDANKWTTQNVLGGWKPK